MQSETHGNSSVGRALVSKTRCREFEPLFPCKPKNEIQTDSLDIVRIKNDAHFFYPHSHWHTSRRVTLVKIGKIFTFAQQSSPTPNTKTSIISPGETCTHTTLSINHLSTISLHHRERPFVLTTTKLSPHDNKGVFSRRTEARRRDVYARTSRQASESMIHIYTSILTNKKHFHIFSFLLSLFFTNFASTFNTLLLII